jgi:hypothetical protein
LITKEQAREKMEMYLRAKDEKRDDKFVLLDKYTREEDFGWVFFYQSEMYVKTGDMRYALGGNAPIIIDRQTGELHVTGTARSLEYYLTEYRQNRRVP